MPEGKGSPKKTTLGTSFIPLRRIPASISSKPLRHVACCASNEMLEYECEGLVLGSCRKLKAAEVRKRAKFIENSNPVDFKSYTYLGKIVADEREAIRMAANWHELVASMCQPSMPARKLLKWI